MVCPKCKSLNLKVIDTRSDVLTVRRRRECTECGHRFTTYEVESLKYGAMASAAALVKSAWQKLTELESQEVNAK